MSGTREPDPRARLRRPDQPRGGVFPARSTAGRIIVEHRGPRPVALSFDYLDAGRGAVSFNLYDEARDRWLYDVADLDRCGSGRWLHAQLSRWTTCPRGLATPGPIELSPVVNGGDFAVRNLRLFWKDARDTARAVSWAGIGPPGRLQHGVGERCSRVSPRRGLLRTLLATADRDLRAVLRVRRQGRRSRRRPRIHR